MLMLIVLLVASAPQVMRPLPRPTVTVAPLPAAAMARGSAIRARLPVAQRAWVDAQSAAGADAATVRANAAAAFPGGDIDSLVLLVMMAAAKQADDALRASLAELQARNAAKAAHRAPPTASIRAGGRPALAPTDSLAEMSESEQLRLQMLMDRRQKALEAVSNLMKKMDDTQGRIADNLK